MKLAVFDDFRIGVVDGDLLFDVTGATPDALKELPAQRMNWLIAHWEAARPRVQSLQRDARPLALNQVKLLAPNPAPPHVFAAPANYRKHVGELGARSVSKGRTAREQGFFLKAPGSVVGAGGFISLPRGSSRRFDHESELAVIIGRHASRVPRSEAMNHVFGYSCLIDATMRIEPGVAEEERSMRKSFAGFTPIGPFLVTADEVADPQNLQNRLWVNGELKQDANTKDMIVDIAELIELISSVLPLQPGDVIATGTPEGVGPFAPGDTVRIAIEGVGDMSLPVRENEVRAPRAY
jgi:2-keto-4-pentenoate hydratase/2-oxohepta-3-ene-1,7-dioic acid hydratase in catechol pathway